MLWCSEPERTAGQPATDDVVLSCWEMLCLFAVFAVLQKGFVCGSLPRLFCSYLSLTGQAHVE